MPAQRHLYRSFFLMPGEPSSMMLLEKLSCPSFAAYAQDITLYVGQSWKPFRNLSLPRLTSLTVTIHATGVSGQLIFRGLGTLLERFLSVESLRKVVISVPGRRHLPPIIVDTPTYRIRSFIFTYDGLSDPKKLDGLLEGVGPCLQDLTLNLQSPIAGLGKKDHIQDLNLCFFPNLRRLKLDIKLWRGESQVLRILDSLPRPAELKLVVIEVDGIRDLAAEVWTGVHDKLTSLEEPPMLHIHVYFKNKSQMDKHEEIACSLFETVFPIYCEGGNDILCLELRCPTGRYKYVFDEDRSSSDVYGVPKLQPFIRF